MLRLSLIAVVILLCSCANSPTSTSDVSAEVNQSQVDALVLQAETLGQQDQFIEAARLYAQAAELSEDPAIAQRATDAAKTTGDWDLARRVAKRWVALDSDAPQPLRVLASIAVLQSDTESALKYLNQLRTVAESQDLADQETFGIILGAKPAVMADLLHAIEPNLKPVPDGALLKGSLELWEVNEFALARSLVDEVLSRDEAALEARQWRAQLSMAMRDFDAAAADFAKLDEMGNASDEDRLSYAAVLYELGDSDSARQQLRLLPDTPPVLYSKGIYALEADDADSAERSLEKILAMTDADGDEQAYFAGQLAEAMDRVDTAIEQYRKVRKGDRMIRARQRLAVLLGTNDRLDEALIVLRNLQNGNRESAITAFMLEAELYNRLDQQQRALKAYDKGLRFLPNDIDLLYARGLQYERLGNLAGIEADLRKILELQPENANAWNALGYTLVDHEIRLQEAEEYLQKAIELDPNSAAIIDSMGWLYYRKGELKKAEMYLRRALVQAYDPEIAAHLSEVLFKRDEIQEAKAILAKALRRFPDSEVLIETRDRLMPGVKAESE